MSNRNFIFVAAFVLAGVATLFSHVPAMAQADGSAVLDSIGRAMNAYHQAQQDYQAVQNGQIPEAIAERIRSRNQQVTMEQARVEARTSLQGANENLETQRTQALAQESGKSEAEVRAMRQSGMGWGRMARDLGVHPSALGIGNAKAVKTKTKAAQKNNKAKGNSGGSKGKGKGKK